MTCRPCVIKANDLCVIIADKNIIADIQVIRVEIQNGIPLLITRKVGCFDRDEPSAERVAIGDAEPAFT